jgi:SAM-dependent methyltransferase
MSFHYFLGEGCLRIGRIIQSMPVMVMRPDDLVRLSRETYSEAGSVTYWNSAEFVGSGLYEPEVVLLQRLPRLQGRLLLLGVGGGREAIPLIQAGFQVTGVDYLAEYAFAAQENARKCGLQLETRLGEISNLDLAGDTFDVIWFSHAIYSFVPTSQRRIAMLKNLHHALAADGRIVCQFHWDPVLHSPRRQKYLAHLLAWLTNGNIRFQAGDMLWRNKEFVHAFASEKEILRECASAGFKIDYFSIFPGWPRGGAILSKA